MGPCRNFKLVDSLDCIIHITTITMDTVTVTVGGNGVISIGSTTCTECNCCNGISAELLERI